MSGKHDLTARTFIYHKSNGPANWIQKHLNRDSRAIMFYLR